MHFSFFHLGRHGLGQERSCYAASVRAATSRMGWGWGGVGWGNNFHAALLMYVQTIDRVWLNLKSWLPPKLRAVEKKVGLHFLNKGVNRMIQQWIWRQSVLPCSPKEMMAHLVGLLKKHHG